MTDQEKADLNVRIAKELFGWAEDQPGELSDATGDIFTKPPNYSDNSGLMVGLEYKLRVRGFDIRCVWPPAREWEYTIIKDGIEHTGISDRKVEALVLAIKHYLDK